MLKPPDILGDHAWQCGALLLILAASLFPIPATAATLSATDSEVIARSLGFLAYDAANAASKPDADAISSLFAGGLTESGSTVTAKSVDQATLASGRGYVAVIAARFSAGATIMEAIKGRLIPCITSEADQVKSGQCVSQHRSLDRRSESQKSLLP